MANTQTLVKKSVKCLEDLHKAPIVNIDLRKINPHVGNKYNLREIDNIGLQDMVEQIALKGGVVDPIKVTVKTELSEDFYAKEGLADDEHATLAGNRRVNGGHWILDNPNEFVDVIEALLMKQANFEEEGDAKSMPDMLVPSRDTAEKLAKKVIKSLESVKAILYGGPPEDYEEIIHDHAGVRTLARCEVVKLRHRTLAIGMGETEFINQYHPLLNRVYNGPGAQAFDKILADTPRREWASVLRKKFHNTVYHIDRLWKMGLADAFMAWQRSQDGLPTKEGDFYPCKLDITVTNTLFKAHREDMNNNQGARITGLDKVNNDLLIHGGGPNLREALNKLYLDYKSGTTTQAKKALPKSKMEELVDQYTSEAVKTAILTCAGEGDVRLIQLDADVNRFEKLVVLIKRNLHRVVDTKAHAFLQSLTESQPFGKTENAFCAWIEGATSLEEESVETEAEAEAEEAEAEAEEETEPVNAG